MDDAGIWLQAVRQATGEFSRLDPAVRRECCSILESMIRLKHDLCRLAGEAGSAETCRVCEGACCFRGKYHLAVADLLAFLCRQAPLPVPDFTRFPDCPWLGEAGCRISPGLRPFTCVVFNCEPIEDRMPEGQRKQFYDLERQLRDRYADLGKLLGIRPMASMLLVTEGDSGNVPLQFRPALS